MELVATQDGFVGEMARGFTFQALGEVAAGFGKRLQAEGIPRVVVGHDARFLAREMAEHAAGVLGGLGLEVHLLQGPAPLPLFGFALRAKEAAGLYLTGSRRPFAFQGVKLRLGPGRPLPGKEVAPAPPLPRDPSPRWRRAGTTWTTSGRAPRASPSSGAWSTWTPWAGRAAGSWARF